MKQTILWLLPLLLMGCKVKKTVTETVSVDTTKTVYDSVYIGDAVVDTSEIDAYGVTYETVLFVDRGGAIYRDSAGRMVLQGVRLYRYASAYNDKRRNGISQQKDSTRASLVRVNGVQERVKQEQPAMKQIQSHKRTVVKYAVSLCCIAALLYLIFLYTKRKL